MKTLVNKRNSAIRIIAPEIIEEEEYYTFFNGENVYLKSNWTLAEEELIIDKGVLFGRRYIPDENRKGHEIEEVYCYGNVILSGGKIHMKDELLKVVDMSLVQAAAELWEGEDAKMEYLHGKIDSLKQVRKWLKNYGQSEDGQGS